MPKKKSAPAATTTVRGKIIAHNISPKGHVEGVLLKTAGGIAQLNLPKHAEIDPARGYKIGASVEVAAEAEDPDGGPHAVYTAHPETGAVTGTIVRLNYARHGEINGYHLDDGTFVHVKPDGAKHYKLKVGDRISAHGVQRVGPHATVLEAEEVSKVSGRATS